jgi:uncharacterized membrane protein (UPF0127 family)
MKTLYVRKAQLFWEKFLGLMFKKEYDGYLLLEKCRSIHTFWMFFPIDIMCISKTGEVLAIKENLSPWRIYCAPVGTYSIIECAVAYKDKVTVSVGDSVKIMY